VLWAAGELDVLVARDIPWNAGAEASISVIAAAGQAIASEQATMKFESRAFMLRLAPGVQPGDYLVRARVTGKAGEGAEASEQVQVHVPAAGDAAAALAQPLLYRRGPFSGVGFQPTADLQFRKAERLRVDVPTAAPLDEVSARLLDRKGGLLPVPVATLQREEVGVRFVSGEVSLAPLALGDYLIEVSVRRGTLQQKSVTAFRIVP
jgi:hypothetical protein